MLSLKPIAAILVFVCLLAGLDSYAQHITLSHNKSSLKSIFGDIEKQTGYVFFYDRALLKLAGKITIHVKDASLQATLDECFKGQPLTWLLAGKTITIKQTGVFEPRLPVAPVPMLVKGFISNESGEPVPGATIVVKGTITQVVADGNGAFVLTADSNARILISSVTYETQEVPLAKQAEIQVRLKKWVTELSQAIVSTGYQRVETAAMTGAAVKIDNTLFNRRISTTVLDRLDGITSGLLFNKNVVAGLNQSNISIRGRSTIFANPEPLIVLDNFPYTGDISNINPADVESVTVLKDAAAAAIWGALSGNGVIVITTKKGKYNQPARSSFTSSVTVSGRPNLFYTPILSSVDYIGVEQFLFSKNAYHDAEISAAHPVLSPAVEIMIKQRDGLISAAEATAQLNQLSMQDTRNEQKKYFYRNSVNQQYAFNLSGGGSGYQYYFSAGYDKNLSNTVGNSYDRITLNANNTYALVKQKLELGTNIIFSSSKTTSDNPGLSSKYPYLKLTDDAGMPATVYTGLRQSYKDTAGGGALLDWDYKPLNELRLADNTARANDIRINLSLKYTIIKGLDAAVYYQYNKGSNDVQNVMSQDTYYTRDLINRFTQINATGVYRPVPLGGIFDKTLNNYEANNVRVQANYNHTWKSEHELTVIAGAEVRSLDASFNYSRLYGYDKTRQTSVNVDYQTDFPLFISSSANKIPPAPLSKSTIDHYISYYSNAVYTWKHRYIVSASARKDEANIFGVKTNQKGVPLWSAGLAWNISREDFYHCSWLPYLKLRVTDGYNGNVDKSVSAFTTILINSTNTYGAPVAGIVNPPNPTLRWEKNNILNIGADFATKHNRVSGSIEYYTRSGKDLIGLSPLDPTIGVTSFKGNTADMSGKGMDLQLNIKSNDKPFRWYGTVLLSYTTDKITSYKVKQTVVSAYLSPGFFNPLEGRSLYAVYALKWMGLDSQGNPLGLFNGRTSNAYSSIINSANLGDLIYKGPANPTVFGSLRNTFVWKQFELSFNVSWKLGYYFRRSSIIYSDVFVGTGAGHSDFDRRWQNPGDEKTTNVPAMVYPADLNRDNLYRYSEILIEKGDHIRLQDIRLSYELNRDKVKKLPVRTAELYVYVNNVGLLWKANDKGIDPDYVLGIPNPRSVAMGMKIDF